MASAICIDAIVPGGTARRSRCAGGAGARRAAWRTGRRRRAAAAASTRSMPACAIASSAPAPCAPAVGAPTGADRSRRPRQRPGIRPAGRPWPGALRRAANRANSCAADGDVAARVALRFDELFESCRLAGASSTDCRRARTAPQSRRRAPTCGRRPDRGLARPGAGGARAPVPEARSALPSARPVLAELAGARACDHRQHRSGFSADQQVLQPVLQRRTISSHVKTLRQIGRVGIVTRGRRRRPIRTLRLRERSAGANPRDVRAGACASAPSMPVHATAASSRSTRSTTRIYNLEGLGIRFVASPRHADLLLVTGPVSTPHGDGAAAHL